MLFKGFHHLRHCGPLLADRDVDANYILSLLINDGVESDGRLAGLPVADDQLTLSPANWHHRVDRFDSRWQRLLHGLPVNHARSKPFQRIRLAGFNRTLAVDWHTERIHDPANQ